VKKELQLNIKVNQMKAKIFLRLSAIIEEDAIRNIPVE